MDDDLKHIVNEQVEDADDVFTVSELNAYIGEQINTDPDIASIALVGEASNVSRSSGGHIFLDLKDDDTQISCVIFADTWERIDHAVNDGDIVLAQGTAEYYEDEGRVTFKVNDIRPIGEGLYYQELRKRMEDLEEDGLFDAEHKQDLPDIPERVGVVTSKEGDAVRDIVSTVHDRLPDVDIYIKHAAVQGDGAADDIVDGIRFFDDEFPVDVVITGRGGGAMEDLHAFNTEPVARAIFAADTPVVTGVGHRTDETIAGHVADHGAITPTAAGKAAVPDKAERETALAELEDAIDTRLEQVRERAAREEAIAAAERRETVYKLVIAALVVLMLLVTAQVML